MFKRFMVLLCLAILAGAAPTWAAPEQYVVDPVHSSIVFRIKHLDISYFYRLFTGVSGTIIGDREKPQNSSVEIAIDAASVETFDAKRDKHLRGPDFLNAKAYPKITFRSTKVEPLGNDRVRVTGDLTMLGTTRPVSLEVTKTGEGNDPWGGYRVGFEGKVTIRRSEWGMTYLVGKGLSAEVDLIIAVEAVRK